MSRASFPIERLDYDLPESLIAQAPLARRDASRLLVVNRATGELAHARVSDLPQHVRPGDALVINDTRVVPAKFELKRRTGGRIEGLFLRETARGRWEVLLKGASRLKPGESVKLTSEAASETARVIRRLDRGKWELETADAAVDVLKRVGRAPLPPYIKRKRGADARDKADSERYQTVYASVHGAVAAPTAGLHFTPQLLDAMQAAGAQVDRVTLHVGYGTFAPVEVDDLAQHEMHEEYFEMTGQTAARLRAVRDRGGRIIAVGTTSARVLETTWHLGRWQEARAGWTALFCYPPYTFHGVDVLLTNFHLPRSTLLALVMAFAGEDLIRRAYREAVDERYRFYSYGDAMLII